MNRARRGPATLCSAGRLPRGEISPPRATRRKESCATSRFCRRYPESCHARPRARSATLPTRVVSRGTLQQKSAFYPEVLVSPCGFAVSGRGRLRSDTTKKYLILHVVFDSEKFEKLSSFRMKKDRDCRARESGCLLLLSRTQLAPQLARLDVHSSHRVQLHAGCMAARQKHLRHMTAQLSRRTGSRGQRQT